MPNGRPCVRTGDVASPRMNDQMESRDGAGRCIGVIGIGPVGGILAAHLAVAGEDVVVVDILEGHLEEIRNNSLRISGVHEMEARIPKAYLSISELKDHDLAYLFVAVKACRG